MPRRRFQFLFAAVCTVVLVAEGYVVLASRGAEFRIHGVETYDLAEFVDGADISQAFMMLGDGLQAIRVLVRSNTNASLRVQWDLWRAEIEPSSSAASAFSGVATFDVIPGRQWQVLTLPRDGSSNDRWYTVRLRLLDAAQRPLGRGMKPVDRVRVSVAASRDNPARGGVLWIDGLRQPGSLYMAAERSGKTAYERFVAAAVPQLPSAFRFEIVHWLIAITVHSALIVFAYALLTEARRS